jgi:hypothetical protein
MSLFQPTVLKKYLSQQDSTTVHKAYKKYIKYFHNDNILPLSHIVIHRLIVVDEGNF